MCVLQKGSIFAVYIVFYLLQGYECQHLEKFFISEIILYSVH